MTLEGEFKLLSAAQVRELAANAVKNGFSRQIDPAKLDKLNEDTYTIAALMTPAAGGPDAPILYHRARLIIRLNGRSDPWRTYLEVSDEDWAPLPDAEAVRAAIRAQEEQE
jgi:hypothetical protein